MCSSCHGSSVSYGERDFCPSCQRIAFLGESVEVTDSREAERQHALALLNTALASYDEAGRQDKGITDEMEIHMGQTIETRGCSKCQGTMYRTVETDENGNPTNMTQFVCGNCGNVE